MNKKEIIVVILIILVVVSFAFWAQNNFLKNDISKIYTATSSISTSELSLSSHSEKANLPSIEITSTEKTEESSDGRSELCENYKEIQNFKEPIPIVWTAKLTGCLESCEGAHFSRIPETENYQYPRFAGYYPDELGKYSWDGSNVQIPGKFLVDGLNLRISGKWFSVGVDHPYTVFEDKCVPIVEIDKIEIIK